MSKKKLPPKFVKAPHAGTSDLDNPLRSTGEAAMMVAPPVLPAVPSDGFVHSVAARFTKEQGEALEQAAKEGGVTVDALLRRVVSDWLHTQAARMSAGAEAAHPVRPRGIVEAVMERALNTLSRLGLRSQAVRNLAGWLAPSSVSRA